MNLNYFGLDKTIIILIWHIYCSLKLNGYKDVCDEKKVWLKKIYRAPKGGAHHKNHHVAMAKNSLSRLVAMKKTIGKANQEKYSI